MKKILLASSAIVAGAAFAAPAMAADGEIVWSAFTQFHASSQESDDGGATNQGLDFNTNSEIHLNAQTTADNGLTYGLHIELEADQSNTNDTDENDIWVSGDFGKVVLGDNDSAGDALDVNATSVGFTYGMFNNFTGVGTPASSGRTSTGFSDSGDSTKITYFTPTFNGFKAGVSFAPDGDEGSTISGSSASFDNHFDGGLNYSGSFNDFSIDAGIGGGTHEVPDSGSDDNTYYGVTGGVRVGYAGFKVAASYSHEDEEDTFDSNTFDIGVGYSTGPWGVTAGASFSERDNDNGGSTDNNEAYSAGVTYEIAPGLNTWLAGTVGDYEGSDSSGNSSGDFSSISTGLAVSF
ncbi:MAG: porin [Halopseudomonas aestusnigri]